MGSSSKPKLTYRTIISENTLFILMFSNYRTLSLLRRISALFIPTIAGNDNHDHNWWITTNRFESLIWARRDDKRLPAHAFRNGEDSDRSRKRKS